MINLVDIPKPETYEESISPYAASEQKIESSLRNLIDQIRTEQLNEFNKRLYSAMNIWLTIASIHPDDAMSDTYMLMSKSVALLIDRSLLTDVERTRCEIPINFEVKKNDHESKE